MILVYNPDIAELASNYRKRLGCRNASDWRIDFYQLSCKPAGEATRELEKYMFRIFAIHILIFLGL